MAVTRYDGPQTVDFHVGGDEYAVMLNTVGRGTFTLYHSTEDRSASTGSLTAGTTFTIGNSADWTGEIPGTVRVLRSRVEPFTGQVAIDTLTGFTHTTGTNSFTFASGVIQTGDTLSATWAVHTGTHNITISATDPLSNGHDFGINNGDHIAVPANASITVETGTNWRPGNK